MAEEFAVDAVQNALVKAGPEGLTKAELEAETGLATEDLREAIADVSPGERGDRLFLDGDGAMVQSTSGRVDDDEEGGGEGGGEAEGPDGPPVPTGDGMLARAQILVDVTYQLEEGKPPDVAAVEAARTLLTDLPSLWPALDVRPKLGTVEVFASKRVWPPPD